MTGPANQDSSFEDWMFESWYADLQQLALMTSRSHLVTYPEDHRDGFDSGNTPEAELNFQASSLANDIENKET